MKNTLLVVALLALSVTLAVAVDCPTVTKKLDCEANAASCAWTDNAEANTCTQSQNCAAQTPVACAGDDFKPFCNTTGSGCADNAAYCSAGGACPADCTTGSTCTAKAGDMGCPAKNNIDGACTTSAFCMQNGGGAITCSAKNNATCTSGANTCDGPCTEASVTCATSLTNQCTIAGTVTAANCPTAQGCVFTDIAGPNPATCTLPACAFTTSATCAVANNGCKVTQYNCSATPAQFTTYCANTSATCLSDAAALKYCSSNKDCVFNPNYCTAGQTQCNASNNQCLVTPTCTNPKQGLCAAQSFATCTANLCSTVAATGCANKTTDAQCTPLNTSAQTCETVGTPGCLFTAGGSCSTKTPDPTPSTSGNVLAFTSALLATALMF